MMYTFSLQALLYWPQYELIIHHQPNPCKRRASVHGTKNISRKQINAYKEKQAEEEENLVASWKK